MEELGLNWMMHISCSMPVIVSLHLTHHKRKVILQARIRLRLKGRSSVFEGAFLEDIGETFKGQAITDSM